MTWEDIYKVWSSSDIKDVDIIDFDSRHHDDAFPWYDKKQKQQLPLDSSPLFRTAENIVSLSKADPELNAAFRIYATHVGQLSPAIDELNHALYEVFNKHGYSNRYWWTPNSKRVLPFLGYGRDYGVLPRYKIEELDSVAGLVNQAALTWKMLSETVAIINVPLLVTNN